jgi:hypothetical protein
MANGDDPILIPPKLRDSRLSQADGNQPERRHPPDWEFMEQARQAVTAWSVYQFFDHNTATHRPMIGTRRYTVPID